MKWTKDETDFLIKNYPTQGSDFCMKYINKDKNQIRKKCSKLNIKLTKKTRSYLRKKVMGKIKIKPKNRVPFENFTKITKKEIAYILGFIWADGYLRKPYSIATQISIKDSINMKDIFSKTGDWNYYITNRYDKRSKRKYQSFIIQTSNKNIVNFLIDNDYDKKSFLSPIKILDRIPLDLIPYFFRGYSDGDGNFYIRQNTYQYTIAGHHDQDWSFMKKLFDNLNISYSTNQINKKHKSSFIRITNKNDIDIFGDYIYQQWDNIGLFRKYEKYLDIKKIQIKRISRWTNKEIEFLKENYKMNHTELAKIMGKTKYSIDTKCSRLKLHKNNIYKKTPSKN